MSTPPRFHGECGYSTRLIAILDVCFAFPARRCLSCDPGSMCSIGSGISLGAIDVYLTTTDAPLSFLSGGPGGLAGGAGPDNGAPTTATGGVKGSGLTGGRKCRIAVTCAALKAELVSQ